MGYQSLFREGAFKGRTIIVTGGGSGIGRCTAHELASLGATVILVGRTQTKLDKVKAEIVEDGGQADTQSFDIRDEAAVSAGIASILERNTQVDGLVNNAGGQFPAPLAKLSKNGFEAVVANNLTGGFLVAREVYNQCMAEHGGSIVNIVADMWNGMPGMGHSGAARAGMLNFTHTAAVEWACSGVRVNAVAPGWIMSSGLDTYEDPQMKAIFPVLKKKVPLKRLGEEAEVSSAICFLLSDAAAFISGDCIKVDGAASCNTELATMPEHENSRPFEGFHRAVRPEIMG